jgi:hypothetical protein
LRFAMRTGRLPLHAFAAAALLDHVEHLETELADEIPVEQLVGHVSTVAIPLALILGAAASPYHVLRVARLLAAKPTRRALVAVIWLGASGRSAVAGDDLLQLLPQPFARDWRRAAAGKQKLAGASLDPLADIRLAEGIRNRLAFLFKPKPKKQQKPKTEFVVPKSATA